MKRFIFPLFILVSAIFIIYESTVWLPRARFLFQSPCAAPITFRIDKVDENFGLMPEEFLADARTAADIWNKAYGQNLLVYDSGGSLGVSLIYDERQSARSKLDELQNQIDTDKNSLDQQRHEYDNLVYDFNQRLADFDTEVDFWNGKGGAPTDTYGALVQKQKELQAEANNLNILAKKLNLSTEDYNLQIGQLTQTVNNYNTDLKNKPEEGIYFPHDNRIEIYLNVNRNELVHTLAHEFGHAIGLDHLGNPEAIMYALTGEQLTPAPEDINALNAYCGKTNLKLITEIKIVALMEWLTSLKLKFSGI